MFIITSIIWKPLIFLALEFCVIKLCTLLCPEVPGAFRAVLFGRENVGIGVLQKRRKIKRTIKIWDLVLFLPSKLGHNFNILLNGYC